MTKIFAPSNLGHLCVPNWDPAPHILEMQQEFLDLARNRFRRLMVSIPIRHGKTEFSNLFIAWLLIFKSTLRILRVMAAGDRATNEARHVLKYIERWGMKLNGAKLDRRRSAAAEFLMEEGGGLLSIGASSNIAEGGTFDFIFIDDIMIDPFEIRNPNRRDQVFRDINSKFFSRVNPLGTTKFVIIGSRRHPDDPQGRFLEADEGVTDEYEKWHYHARPAILKEGTDNEQALWPTSKEWTLEGLKAERDKKISQGVHWEWYCNFQNEPVSSPDMMAFDSSWFDPKEMFYTCPQEALPEIKHRVISFDPSMGDGSAMNDYFVGLYLLFTRDTVYVDDSYLAVAAPDTAVDMSVALVERCQNVDMIFFESNAGGYYIAKCIGDKCKERDIAWNPFFKNWSSGDQKLDNKDQQGRITLNLWKLLSEKKVKLRDTPWNRILFRQLRGFPTEKVDGPDALATGIICLRQLMFGSKKK